MQVFVYSVILLIITVLLVVGPLPFNVSGGASSF